MVCHCEFELVAISWNGEETVAPLTGDVMNTLAFA
jgi:hypothetical protein